MLGQLFKLIFGDGRNVVKETAEVFRPNAENEAQRGADFQAAALNQFAAEYMRDRKGWFDVLIDGLNRIPRPAMALGTLALIVSAMWEPVWFAERMQGLALVPEPLWWLMGAIVSFYFGARHQAKAQQFQEGIALTMARVPQVVENIKSLRTINFGTPGVADTGSDAELNAHVSEHDPNPVVDKWQN